jgi:hypothetical protein
VCDRKTPHASRAYISLHIFHVTPSSALPVGLHRGTAELPVLPAPSWVIDLEVGTWHSSCVANPYFGLENRKLDQGELIFFSLIPLRYFPLRKHTETALFLDQQNLPMSTDRLLKVATAPMDGPSEPHTQNPTNDDRSSGKSSPSASKSR